MTIFFQLIYISTACEGVGAEHCRDILETSRTNNARRNVTGLLLFNSKRFLQALEGNEEDVRSIYAAIQADNRHHGLVVIGEKHSTAREFGQWSMAFDEAPGSNRSLTCKIGALLDRVEASTRALFETSARLYPSGAVNQL